MSIIWLYQCLRIRNAKIKVLAFASFARILDLARFGFSQRFLLFSGSYSLYFLTLHSNDFLTPIFKRPDEGAFILMWWGIIWQMSLKP